MTTMELLKKLKLKQNHFGCYAIKLAVEFYRKTPDDFYRNFHKIVLKDIGKRLGRTPDAIEKAIARECRDAYLFDSGQTMMELFGLPEPRRLSPTEFIIEVAEAVSK